MPKMQLSDEQRKALEDYYKGSIGGRMRDKTAKTVDEKLAEKKSQGRSSEEARGIGGFTPSEMVDRRNHAAHVFLGSSKGNLSAIDHQVASIFANTGHMEEAVEKIKKQLPNAWNNKYTKQTITSNLKTAYSTYKNSNNWAKWDAEHQKGKPVASAGAKLANKYRK
jgi:hypothetical protein